MTYRDRRGLIRQMRSDIYGDKAAYHLSLIQTGQLHTYSFLDDMSERYHSRRASVLLRKAIQVAEDPKNRARLLRTQISISEKLSDLYERHIEELAASRIPRFIKDYLISHSAAKIELYKGRSEHSREILRAVRFNAP